MRDSLIALVGGAVVTPHRTFDPGVVVLDGARIGEVGSLDSVKPPKGCQTVDVSGAVVCPGFVEVHIHGWEGILMGDVEGSPASATNTVDGDIAAAAQRLPASGITSFLPTVMGLPSLEAILSILGEASQSVNGSVVGAHVLGLHMEGPYFNPAPKGPYDVYPPAGAQPTEFFRKPSLDELSQMIEASRGTLMMMCLSPEIDGALELIQGLRKQGIVASGAHTLADYDQTMAAVATGMSTVTHMYNGMRHQDHRAPGIIEAALASDEITVQIISDGIHVHESALKIAFRCKGRDRMAITTDNACFAGMPNGRYADQLGRQLEKTDDYARIVGGSLAGSVMPMNRQLDTLHRLLGLSIEDVIYMATVVPARLIGVSDRKGSLQSGEDADIVVFKQSFEIERVYCRGELAFPLEREGR